MKQLSERASSDVFATPLEIDNIMTCIAKSWETGGLHA
jgi:hypothetical protein